MDYHDDRVGTGSGNAVFALSANRGPTRTGTLTIQGGQTITVTQLGTASTDFDNNTPLPIPDNNGGVDPSRSAA